VARTRTTKTNKRSLDTGGCDFDSFPSGGGGYKTGHLGLNKKTKKNYFDLLGGAKLLQTQPLIVSTLATPTGLSTITVLPTPTLPERLCPGCRPGLHSKRQTMGGGGGGGGRVCQVLTTWQQDGSQQDIYWEALGEFAHGAGRATTVQCGQPSRGGTDNPPPHALRYPPATQLQLNLKRASKKNALALKRGRVGRRGGPRGTPKTKINKTTKLNIKRQTRPIIKT
jgi:hypothetical protein